MQAAVRRGSIIFLLTRPLRDVTTDVWIKDLNLDISTHTPLTGRDDSARAKACAKYISTHTPLTGRDFLYR